MNLPSENPSASDQEKRGYRQLSLKAFLIGTSCCCLLFAANRGEEVDYAWLAIQIATMIVGIGIWQQGTDIHTLLRSGAATSEDLLRSIRFERNWRWVLSSCVFIGWVIASLNAQDAFGKWERDPDASFRIWPSAYAEGTAMLLLTIGLLNPVLAVRRPQRSTLATIVDYVGWIAAAIVIVLSLRQTALIDGLVHIAIRGIEMAAAPPYDNNFYPGGVPRYEASTRLVTSIAVALATLVAISAAMLVRATSRKNQRLAVIGFIAAAVVAGMLAGWLRLAGFETVSPMLASTRSFWLPEVWHFAAPLIALFVLAASRRLSGYSVCDADCLSWRPEGRVYLSECRLLLVAVPIAVIGPPIQEMWQYAYLWNGAFGIGNPSNVRVFFYVFEEPSFYLNLAVAFSALFVARLRIRGGTMPGEVPPTFSYISFGATCIAVVLTLYFAIEATIWCSFAYSISPH